MYKIIATLALQAEIEKYNKLSTEIGSAIKQLTENPFSRAIETNIPRYGKYYVDTGRFSISFDVNAKEVILRYVCN